MAKKQIKAWFFAATHMGTGGSVVYAGGATKADAEDWAKNLRAVGERTGPVVRLSVPAPPADPKACNCRSYNGGPCFNCVNNGHRICRSSPPCNRSARPKSPKRRKGRQCLRQ